MRLIITAFISPFISERNHARQIIADDEFIEVFIDTLSFEGRDPTYIKKHDPENKNFTGITQNTNSRQTQK